jgi:hypothetical protein
MLQVSSTWCDALSKGLFTGNNLYYVPCGKTQEDIKRFVC